MSLKLTKQLRERLKSPIGKICHKINEEEFLITVGDQTSITAIEDNITPDLIIYDGKIQRKKETKIQEKLDKINVKKIEVNNPAGMITDEVWIAVKEGLKERSKIKVNGEEDLLVIPCVNLAQENSVIYYGQPGVGMIKVIADKKTKNQINQIMKEMEVIE